MCQGARNVIAITVEFCPLTEDFYAGDSFQKILPCDLNIAAALISWGEARMTPRVPKRSGTKLAVTVSKFACGYFRLPAGAATLHSCVMQTFGILNAME